MNEIQTKRSSIIENKESFDLEKKKKEDKIKKNLAEQRRIINVMTGIESTNRKPLYSENILISTTSSKGSKFSKKIILVKI